jgi:hypothetical protein
MNLLVELLENFMSFSKTNSYSCACSETGHSKGLQEIVKKNAQPVSDLNITN